jgi:hypothetical protein
MLMQGTVFIWLYLVLAPAGALLLLVQTIRRVIHDPQHRLLAAGVGAAVLVKEDVDLCMAGETARH